MMTKYLALPLLFLFFQNPPSNSVKWVLAYNSTGQSIPGSFADTLLTFNTSDPHTTNSSMHSTTSNTGRLVAPVTGWYAGACEFTSSTSPNDSDYAEVRLNGSTVIAAAGVGSTANTNGFELQVPYSYKLTAGQYVECHVSVQSAVTTNAGLGQTQFSLYQIH